MVSSKLADHVVLAVKDEMRGVRYRVNSGIRRSRELAAARGPLMILEPVASVADVVMTGVEAAASALLSRAEPSPSPLSFPLPIESYFGRSRPEAQNAHVFGVAIYSALRGLLRGFGAEAYLIHELAIDTAWDALQDRHRDLIASVMDHDGAVAVSSRDENVRRLCAAIAHVVADHRPIKQLALDADDSRTPKHLLLSPNFYCCMVVGLATAIVSLTRDANRLDKREIVAAADAGVDARFSRLTSAARDRDPVGALASEFAAVLPYLS
ncbi:MAG: hypothetical protein ACLPSW_06925 [Roseiarcus sp.]